MLCKPGIQPDMSMDKGEWLYIALSYRDIIFILLEYCGLHYYRGACQQHLFFNSSSTLIVAGLCEGAVLFDHSDKMNDLDLMT